MFMVVELENGKIIWNDQKIADTKESAESRISIFNKQLKHKHFQIIKLTKYKLVN